MFLKQVLIVPQSKVGQALGFVLSKKVKCSYFKGQGNNTNLGAKEYGVLRIWLSEIDSIAPAHATCAYKTNEKTTI